MRLVLTLGPLESEEDLHAWTTDGPYFALSTLGIVTSNSHLAMVNPTMPIKNSTQRYSSIFLT